MLQYWLWLTTRRNVGRKRIRNLLERYETPEAIYRASAQDYENAELDASETESLLQKDLAEARKILLRCEEKQIEILTIQDSRYPERLRQIDDPPVLLYYRGTLPDFDKEPAITVVGARNATAYGEVNARRLGYQLGRCGMLVVTGIARGIDAQALEGALTADATVCAVLGCGADVVYPKQNAALYQEVIRHGCLLTEYPPGTPPEGRHFPVRNRILSALSLGVLVVEASLKSGALITARRALEQGRDVFAVPANIDLDTAAGSNRLLRDGAIWTECGWDVAREYAHLFPEQIQKYASETEPPALVAQKESPNSEKIMLKDDKIRIDNQKSKRYIDLHKIWNTLDETEQAIAAALEGGPKGADEMMEDAQIPASKVLAALTMLEVQGIVKRLPGGVYTLAEEP